MRITASKLAKVAKRKRNGLMGDLAGALNTLLPQYGIVHPMEVAVFLANGAVETAWFSRLEENMNYSESRLKQVYSYYKKRRVEARSDARKPSTIANKVYADKNRSKRYKLGNTREGDGWKYRGSGFFQTTGKTNFRAVERATGMAVIENPELLREPYAAVQSACEYWVKKKIGPLARSGDITAVRKAINGGTHGLSDVKSCLPRATKMVGTLTLRDGYTASTPRAPKDAITPDSDPDDIRDMQQMLNDRNFFCGRVDGDWGTGTSRGVRDYRSATGLKPVDALWVQIEELGKQDKFIIPERVDLTAEKLRDNDSRGINFSDIQDKIGKGLTCGAGIEGARQMGVGDIIDDNLGKVDQIKGWVEKAKELSEPITFLFQLALQYWWIILLVVGFYVITQSKAMAEWRVEIGKSGKHR